MKRVACVGRKPHNAANLMGQHNNFPLCHCHAPWNCCSSPLFPLPTHHTTPHPRQHCRTVSSATSTNQLSGQITQLTWSGLGRCGPAPIPWNFKCNRVATVKILFEIQRILRSKQCETTRANSPSPRRNQTKDSKDLAIDQPPLIKWRLSFDCDDDFVWNAYDLSAQKREKDRQREREAARDLGRDLAKQRAS